MSLKGLDYQPSVLPLTKGMQTKHDKRSLPVAELANAENCVFDKDGGIQKAHGRTNVSLIEAGGAVAITDVKAVMPYKDELLVAADNSLYSRAPDAGRDAGDTVDAAVVNRGRFESVRVEHETILTPGSAGDRAEYGGVEVYAYEDATASSIRYRAIDQATGAILNTSGQTDLHEDQTVTGSAVKVRTVGTKIHVYYTTGATLKRIVIDPDDIENTLDAAGSSLAVNVNASYHYDVDTSATQAYIVYRNTTGAGEYTALIVDSDGTVDTALAKSRACLGVLSVSYNATSSRLMVGRMSAAATVHADILFSSNLTDGTMNISVDTITPLAITSIASSTTDEGYIFYESLEGTSYYRVKRAAIASGAATLKTLVRHSYLASRALLNDDGRAILLVRYEGANQEQYVLLDGEKVVGSSHATAGTQAAGEEVGLLARLFPGEAGAVKSSLGHLPQIEKTATDTYKYLATTYDRGPTSQWGSGRVITSWNSDFTIRNVTFTFGDARSYDGVEVGDTLYVPGGYLAQYDGRRMVEAGFWAYPPMTDALVSELYTSGTNTLTADGTYTYRCYWEWRNDRGEVEQSTALPVSGTVESLGGNDSFRLTVPTLPYTVKKNVVLAVYRSVADPPTGGPLRRVSSSSSTNTTTYLENLPNSDVITWDDDDYNDAEALENQLDYQNTGELDNVPPQASPLVISEGQNRIFWVHPESRHTIYYSKLTTPGTLVAFNESLTLKVPDAGGKVVAIMPGEDSVYIFKERAVYLTAGTGPDNLGAGDYTPPQLVSHDQGCTDARTVVRVPGGVMFKSKKGWQFIDRGHQVHYIGGPVEDLNDRTVTGVLPYPSDHRVVILSSDAAGSYMYDYRLQQWSDWTTLAAIVDGTVSQNLAYYIEPTDAVSVETPAAWVNPLTNIGFQIVVDTGWISFDQLDGYAKARKWQLLGGWHGAQSFNVRVRVAYSYNDTWVDDFTFSPDSTDETAGYPLRIGSRFTRMNAGSVRIRIEDAAQGSNTLWGEAMRLTGIAFEIGTRRGLYRLPATQKTG